MDASHTKPETTDRPSAAGRPESHHASPTQPKGQPDSQPKGQQKRKAELEPDAEELPPARMALLRQVLRALRATWRVELLRSQGTLAPLIMWMNPGGNHYHFVTLSLLDAVKAYSEGKPVDIFLVDSLSFQLSDPDPVKFLVLAAICFQKKGLEWLERAVAKELSSKSNAQAAHFVNSAIPATFLDNVTNLDIRVTRVKTIQQKNGFDCGIFALLFMNRLDKHLYDDTSGSTAASKLEASHLETCLKEQIETSSGPSKPPDQAYVTKWRTAEFLYLLSLWVKHVTTLLGIGGLAEINKKFGTTYQKIFSVPFFGVKYEGRRYYIKSVDYRKWVVTVTQGSQGLQDMNICLKKNSKWWKQMKFIWSPPTGDLSVNFLSYNLKEYVADYVPSFRDLSKFFPGHSEDTDKYINSDYIFWKLRVMDKAGSINPNANVCLGIDTAHVTGVTSFLRIRNSNHQVKKRKREKDEQVDLTNA